MSARWSRQLVQDSTQHIPGKVDQDILRWLQGHIEQCHMLDEKHIGIFAVQEKRITSLCTAGSR